MRPERKREVGLRHRGETPYRTPEETTPVSRGAVHASKEEARSTPQTMRGSVQRHLALGQHPASVWCWLMCWRGHLALVSRTSESISGPKSLKTVSTLGVVVSLMLWSPDVPDIVTQDCTHSGSRWHRRNHRKNASGRPSRTA